MRAGDLPTAEVLAESVREQRTEIWEKLVSQGDERMLERYLNAWDRVPLDFLDALIEASLKAKRPEYTAVLLRYKRDRYLQGECVGHLSSRDTRAERGEHSGSA